MPLDGYLKHDRSRISSISPGSVERRKRIKPVQRATKSMYVTLYVMDCVSHTSPSPSIPVMLKAYKHGVGWEDLGVAQCCPLCWVILKPPVDVVIPKPSRLPKPKPVATPKQRSSLASHRAKGRPPGPTKKTVVHVEKIKELIDLDHLSASEVAAQLGMVRSRARQLLEQLVTSGYAVADRGDGPPRQVYYTKAP